LKADLADCAKSETTDLDLASLLFDAKDIAPVWLYVADATMGRMQQLRLHAGETRSDRDYVKYWIAATEKMRTRGRMQLSSH
jgi:hypothetical protein